MIKFIFIGLCAATTILAYDFSDSAYNNELLEDYLHYTSVDEYEYPIARARRDTDNKCHRHHHKKNVVKCCSDNSPISSSIEDTKRYKRECYNEIHPKFEDESANDFFSCDRLNKTRAEITCVMECVGKKQKTIDDAGNLIPEAIKKYFLEEFASNEWQKKVAADITDRCVAEVKKEKDEEAKNPPAPIAGVPTCNNASSKLGYCIWREFVRACPASFQDKSKRCDSLRDKLAKNQQLRYEYFKSVYRHLQKYSGSDSDKDSDKDSDNESD